MKDDPSDRSGQHDALPLRLEFGELLLGFLEFIPLLLNLDRLTLVGRIKLAHRFLIGHLSSRQRLCLLSHASRDGLVQ